MLYEVITDRFGKISEEGVSSVSFFADEVEPETPTEAAPASDASPAPESESKPEPSPSSSAKPVAKPKEDGPSYNFV